MSTITTAQFPTMTKTQSIITWRKVQDQQITFMEDKEVCHVALAYICGIYAKFRVVKRFNSDNLYILQRRMSYGWGMKWETVIASAEKTDITKKAYELIRYSFSHYFLVHNQTGSLNIQETVKNCVLACVSDDGVVYASDVIRFIQDNIKHSYKFLPDGTKASVKMTEAQIKSAIARLTNELSNFNRVGTGVYKFTVV